MEIHYSNTVESHEKLINRFKHLTAALQDFVCPNYPFAK
jgi:hypothetical protein